jgi:hypothetical protein
MSEQDIAQQSTQIKETSQRLLWALRGFSDRLLLNSCDIPFTDASFASCAEHVLVLVHEMKAVVSGSRTSLMAEMQGDESASDCLIWRNASKGTPST